MAGSSACFEVTSQCLADDLGDGDSFVLGPTCEAFVPSHVPPSFVITLVPSQ